MAGPNYRTASRATTKMKRKAVLIALIPAISLGLIMPATAAERYEVFVSYALKNGFGNESFATDHLPNSMADIKDFARQIAATVAAKGIEVKPEDIILLSWQSFAK
jgi:hypothetical protein